MVTPVSGLYAIGNGMTPPGQSPNPAGTDATAMDPKKKIMLAMLGQQMQKMGQQGMAMPQPRPRESFDIYGNPIR